MGKETSNGTRFGRGKGGTDVLPEAQGVGVGERKIANVVEVDGIKRCSAVISGRACNATIKPPGRFCEKCGAKLVYSDGRRETQFLASQGGRVEMKTPKAGLDVELDPAGRHDADAVRAALKNAERSPRRVAEDEDETMAFEVDKDGKIRPKGPYKG